VRTVKTASGARAVQIVYSSRRGSRDIEHIGSAHDDAESEVLKAAARQRLAAGQGELDLDPDRCRPRGSGWSVADHVLADGPPVRRPVGVPAEGSAPAYGVSGGLHSP